MCMHAYTRANGAGVPPVEELAAQYARLSAAWLLPTFWMEALKAWLTAQQLSSTYRDCYRPLAEAPGVLRGGGRPA